MANIYVTSDTHFNHKNIIEYCNRPYSSVEEMNKAIIDNWNSVVKDEDTEIPGTSIQCFLYCWSW